MQPVNGHSLSGDTPPDPRRQVAEAVYMAMMDEGDPPFSDIEDEDLGDILHLTEQYLKAHLSFLTSAGLRIIPVGAVAVPKSEEEALAMVQAAQTFLDSRKRKKKLIGGAPRKLILPPGVKKH